MNREASVHQARVLYVCVSSACVSKNEQYHTITTSKRISKRKYAGIITITTTTSNMKRKQNLSQILNVIKAIDVNKTKHKNLSDCVKRNIMRRGKKYYNKIYMYLYIRVYVHIIHRNTYSIGYKTVLIYAHSVLLDFVLVVVA